MELGICYYPEQWPRERWAVDVRLMKEAGLSIVRIAEFAWTFMEPEEGEFTWEWLDSAVETISTEGLKLILCTPTATPPAWLVTAHPDVLPVDEQGRRRRFGSRRHYCPSSEVYRQHTARIVDALAARYGKHPAVIGWQIDNEFGLHETARCYCDECARRFREWLCARYETLDALNEAWGAAFWNQLYTDWDQIHPPNLTVTEPNPGHVLDYYRFSSDRYVVYQQLQIDLLRAHSPGRLITHNFMGNFPDLDYHSLAQPLDLVTWDSYPTGYVEHQSDTLYAPDDPRPNLAYDAGDPYVTGFCHDIMRGLKQAPFWVMEQQCGQVNWSDHNTGIRPGTVRLWTWHALAHGADKVVYFRWRATPLGQEQYHSGLLHHDTTPDVGYHDVVSMADERAAMAPLVGQRVDAQAALLLDYESLWAIQIQPHRRGFGYLSHLFRYYAALMRLGITTDVVSPLADLSAYRLVISPSHLIASEAHAAHLTTFVEQGGHLLVGVRSGFKTPSNRVTVQPLPGMLRELAGVTVTSWQSLRPEITFRVQSSIPGLNGSAGGWAEALQPDADTDSLAEYLDGPYAGASALTAYCHGAGMVAYLGWLPTYAQAHTTIGVMAERAGIAAIGPLPEGVTCIQRGDYAVLTNFTEQAHQVQIGGQVIRVEPRGVVRVAR